MDYEAMCQELSAISPAQMVKLVLSGGKGEVTKAVIKPLQIKGNLCLQWEQFVRNQAFQEILSPEAFPGLLKARLAENAFREINCLCKDKTLSYHISKKKKILRQEKALVQQREVNLSHNRKKQYIFTEGMEIQPLVDLGIFDQSFHIVKAKYDKYKQINRFIEIIDQEMKDYPNSLKDEITVIDFGCGKSYLTFFLYYYFSTIRGWAVKITGYDLKEDVVAHCNAVAEKYGYTGLHFVQGDITKLDFSQVPAQMIVTLHACDIATDYALHFAAKNRIPYLFSVPCCQHELNGQIAHEGPLSVLLRHGLYKERFSSLLTDAIRCQVLTNLGYEVDVVEFVDFENTPKNAMIRGHLTPRRPKPPETDLTHLTKELHLSPTLLRLFQEDSII